MSASRILKHKIDFSGKKARITDISAGNPVLMSVILNKYII